jgi:hypothetical protein
MTAFVWKKIAPKQRGVASMEYKGFQRTMAFFGALLILISTALVAVSTRNVEEIVGQMLFFLILFGALWYGKRGGIITAILSTAIYLSLHFSAFLTMGWSKGLEVVGPLIIVRAAIYLVAGALGGEIFFRIKQFMIEAGKQEFVDRETKLFNSGYFGTLVNLEAKKFERYNTISSVLVIKLDPDTMVAYMEEPKTPGMKYIADGLVGNVRLVDEVGRIDKNSFGVILPFTPKEGAEVVAKRLASITTSRVGYDNAVDFEIISLPADKDRFDQMAASLTTEA